METLSRGAPITLAIDATKKSKIQSCNAAAKLYKVPRCTLLAKLTSRPSRISTQPNS